MNEARHDASRTRSPHGERVLIVSDSLDNGGMERQLALLAESFPETWTVRVVALADGVFADVLREAGVELTIVPRASRFDVRPTVPLAGIIRDWRPDVVHAFGWISSAASLYGCRTTGTPLVDACIQEGRVDPRRGRFMRMTTSMADVVIANSQAGLDAYGIGPDRGRVVRNAFDPSRWELCVRTRPAESAPTVVVMTGRMHRHKDFRTFLEAARLLSADEPGAWRFLAVGDGDDRGPLLDDFADLVETGAAEFPLVGNEVLGVVSNADIGALLTNPEFAAEGISNSIMEYMACALPVVCTSTGGNPELVLEGRTGYLVAPGDAESFAGRLRHLREHPTEARQMGELGRERIRDDFTVDALVAGTIAAYRLAMERRANR